MPHPRFLLRLLLLLALPALSGCCGIARLWCGPDQSEWVQVRFDTPRQAIDSFREAARRDDPQVVYRCLSEGFKRRTGIKGVIEAEIGWKRIKEQTSHVHMIGYANVSEPRRMPDGRLRYELEVSGFRMHVWVVDQPYWEILWREDGDPEDIGEDGRYIDQFGEILEIERDSEPGMIEVEAELPPLDDHGLREDQLVRVAAGRAWKIDDLQQVDEDEEPGT